jgi:excisionase family DNA binding protein
MALNRLKKQREGGGAMNEVLLLKPADAARALAICERTLRALTARGEIMAVRVGRAVRYHVADLRAWIESNKHCGARRRASLDQSTCGRNEQGLNDGERD